MNRETKTKELPAARGQGDGSAYRPHMLRAEAQQEGGGALSAPTESEPLETGVVSLGDAVVNLLRKL